MDLSNMNMDDLKKKGIKILIIFGIVVVVLIVGIFVSQAIFGSVLPYDRVEEILASSAESYYKANEDKLPTVDGESVTVKHTKLTEEGYMKEITKYTKEEEECTAEVTVTKNGKNFIYTPVLTCGKNYKTEFLVDVIKDAKVQSQAGVHFNENTNEYVYKGEYVDNYVEYGGKTFRILKVTADNKIRMIQEDLETGIIWDNRYNADVKNTVGINNFSLSRLKETLDNFYKDGKVLGEEYHDIVIPQSKCTEYQTVVDEEGNESQECKTYAFQNQNYTTLYAEEFVAASLDSTCSGITDRRCSNYNYLSRYDKPYWTMTADTATTYKAYKIDTNLDLVRTSSKSGLKAVIELSEKTLFESGNGSTDKPYKIKRLS